MNCALKIILFLISAVGSQTAFAKKMTDQYLFVTGYGEEKEQAVVDAKQQLALQLYSQVEVEIHNRQQKKGNNVDSSFSLESKIKSIPIAIKKMEVVDYSCEKKQCEYRFKIDKWQWVSSLKQDISANHQLAKDFLQFSGNQWRDLQRLGNAKSKLDESRQWTRVLASLEPEKAEEWASSQNALERQVYSHENNFSITLRSSSDAFSSKIVSLFSHSAIVSANGNMTVHIKGSTKKGKKDNYYIAQQSLLFRIFEASNPGVIVSQKQVSEIGKSPESVEQALTDAQQQIIKKLEKNSIYSLLK